MLNAEDQTTFVSLRELTRTVRESNKPLVLWVGAGASKWLDYPLWKELARDLRREFCKYVSGFDDEEALRLIATDFPTFFQYCKGIDSSRYYRFLSNTFLPKPETLLYRRFVDSLAAVAPLYILTTNVDEALEQRFPTLGVFQRSDITGCVQQLNEKRPFIAKLHGSRSSIEGTVFTQSDYEAVKNDSPYQSTLKFIFTAATVVFLGYSISEPVRN
jgi:hypothetical protein